MDEPDYAKLREAMVRDQLEGRDICDPEVLRAMRRVPRHEFLPPEARDRAYLDGAQAIGHGQTLSQPYIVALTTQLARAGDAQRALDVGTGSGYQAAVLAEIVPEVYAIERVPELAQQARERLARLGYTNVRVRCGDGYEGWPEAAPFDVIVVACAAPEPPPRLIEQLAPGGRLVLPLGELPEQWLVSIVKAADGTLEQTRACPVLFVPMVPGT